MMKKFYTILQLTTFLFFLLQIPNLLQAQSDQYLHFDRQNDYVRLDNGSSYITNATGFTMAGWFYTDESAYGQGMLGIRGANSGFYMIQLNNGTIECRFQNSNGTLYEYVAPNFTIVPETWQHFAWVYTGSRIILYVNGIEKGSKIASGRITDSTIPFTVGRSILGNLDFYFGGRADEVSLWSKALDATEIQNMIASELQGDEANLELYYKFNQGLPDADNTSISKLKSEVGNGERDADLVGFALTGSTSNFGGELDLGFQAITFPQIPNKLTTSESFELEGAASSGLPVSYAIVSGPATIEGKVVTLKGEAGEVVIEANQEGGDGFDAAEPLRNTFIVLDPQTHVPEIELRNPVGGIVYAPDVTPIMLSAIIDITYRELFDVDQVRFEINGETITPTDWNNHHYTAWWTPPSHGFYTFNVVATNNYGAAGSKSTDFNLVTQAIDVEVKAVENALLNTSISSVTVDAELPSYVGAFDQIIATLELNCPAGGCGEWDRVVHIEAKGHDGKWVEIIRYITPYSTACASSIDLSDYASILNGKVAFRINYPTFDNGYLYNLTFNYHAGKPLHNYSKIDILWNQSFPFGDPANLQPVESVTIPLSDDVFGAMLKLVSTGHGWGDNNTANAAEFHDDTHHIWVNGVQTFEQRNWVDCNPNPDSCQPQNGTWFHDRAGWCPGAIAPWFDFNMTSFILEDQVEIGYVFDEDYVDNCHPNNPACITGVTCMDCNDGFNPELIVAANFITFSNKPIDGSVVSTDIDDFYTLSFRVFPNPSTGIFNLTLKETVSQLDIRVFNNVGQVVTQFSDAHFNADKHTLNLKGFPQGIYMVEVKTDKGAGLKKVVVE
ncbi:MAG: LamG-like jellyroll fold domain-containing protein [Chitinophagales bacterium]